MADGSSLAQITQAYLDRIQTIDRQGPTLNSVIELNPEALQDADRPMPNAPRNAARPLHGVPGAAERQHRCRRHGQSAGSLALADNRPQQDAFWSRVCVRRVPSYSAKRT
jgi:amidase